MELFRRTWKDFWLLFEVMAPAGLSLRRQQKQHFRHVGVEFPHSTVFKFTTKCLLLLLPPVLRWCFGKPLFTEP